MTPSGIEPATFRLVALYLIQLRHHVPPPARCEGTEISIVLQYFVVSKYCIEFHPRTGHEGPEEGERYCFTLSLTSALDGGGWLTPAPALSSQGQVFPLQARCGPEGG